MKPTPAKSGIIMARVEGSGTAATEMVSSNTSPVGKLTGNAGLSKPPLMSRFALAQADQPKQTKASSQQG
jgi:hypothetical protein